MAWAAETENLPGFVVLTSTGKYGQAQPIASRQWQQRLSAEPLSRRRASHRKGDPVLYVESPGGRLARSSSATWSTRCSELNRSRRTTAVDDPEIATRIAQYEMAFQMQTSVPELMDISDEPQHVLDLYGTKGADGTFAANCLLARRLAERGVRFIQLYHRDWDHHGGLKDADRRHRQGGRSAVRRPWSTDLKNRGMLDDTLIVWTANSAARRWPRATAATIT